MAVPVAKKIVRHEVVRQTDNLGAVPELSLAEIPDRQFAAEYVSRMVKGTLDLEVLDFAYKQALNVLLFGPTGSGKTSFALAWAARRRKRFYSISSNVAIDPSQMFGRLLQNEIGVWVWIDGGATDVVRNGGVLLINEVNFLPERIATVVFGLLDKRREIVLMDHKGEVVRAHRPNCWCDLPAQQCADRWVLVIADMNPDYAGTRPLNAAFRNRFPMQIDWDYDLAIEEKLTTSGTLRKITANLRRLIGTKLDTPVSTNMLQEFELIAQSTLGLDWAIENFCYHFGVDEQAAVNSAFDDLKQDLIDDFTPDVAAEWNQFEGANADWLQEPAAGVAAVPARDEWEQQLMDGSQF